MIGQTVPDAKGMLVAAFGAAATSAQAPAAAAAPDNAGGPWWTSPALWALAAIVAVVLFAEV